MSEQQTAGPGLEADARDGAAGGLLYLMGASGAGKDSLMAYARERIGDDAGVVFAHRYITRPAGSGGENHVELSAVEFELRSRHGLFLFDWRSHGLRYGIGMEVEHWLQRGLHVVINGSRAYLPRARRRVPRLLPVMVRVSPQRLHERLHLRGREMTGDLRERLERGAAYDDIDAPGLRVINNDASLSEAGEQLVAMLRALCAESSRWRGADRC